MVRVTPEQVGRRCDNAVAHVIDDHMRFVDDAQAKSEVAFMGAASAIGTAAGAFYAVHKDRLEGASQDDVAAALWSILQPMVARSIGRLRNEIRGERS